MKRIVAGVDGSRGSQRALAWAVAEAAARGARLAAVHAYPLAHATEPPLPRDVDVRRAAERLVDEAIARLGAVPAGVDIERRVRPVREGGVAKALLDEAAVAELLVVGSRGLGGFMALLIGSVSQQCVAHAPCPVVVVPGERADAQATAPAGEPATADA